MNQQALSLLKEWDEVRLPCRISSVTRTCPKWHEPKTRVFKINVDANFFAETLETGVGMIVHDDLGEFVVARTLYRSGLLRVDDGEA